LRRHYESPSELVVDTSDVTYPIPNGHLIGSSEYNNSNYHPYDDYMHSNSPSNDPQQYFEEVSDGAQNYDVLDEEEDLANQEEAIYSEDGMFRYNFLLKEEIRARNVIS
jgi:hypothetical protein